MEKITEGDAGGAEDEVDRPAAETRLCSCAAFNCWCWDSSCWWWC